MQTKGGFLIVVKEGRRKRYIGFQVCFPNNEFRIKKTEMIKNVRKKCSEIFDDHCKQMGLFVLRFNGEQGIIRCRHTEKDNTIKLLKSIKEINGQKVTIETVGTSGTIKSLINKHMKKFQKK